MFRKGGSILAAVAFVQAQPTQEDSPKEKVANLICKPSDLPLYTPLVDSEPKPKHDKQSKIAETIETSIRSVHKEVSKVSDLYHTQKAHVDRYYVEAMKDTQYIRNYLQEEDNTLPRVGAIAVGSLAGVVLGVRGGFFRKLFYASVTGSAVGSVCYPREARKYATVAYNFAYGIKPGDERQKDLPKFPTTLVELKDNVVSLSSMAYNSVFGDKK